MGHIIIPRNYSFRDEKEQSLDLEVDKLTREFDTSAELREAFADHYLMVEVPASWMDMRSPVFHGKRAAALLQYVRDMREEIETYEPPRIITIPADPDVEKRQELQQAWAENLQVQQQVKEYEHALGDAHFEFCKQSMNYFLGRIRDYPLDEMKKQKELQEFAQKFSPDIFVRCDHLYYNAACSKLQVAFASGAILNKSTLGSFFVLTPQEEQELLVSEHKRIAPKKPH